MTAKKKSAPPKFEGALAEPILAPFEMMADKQLGPSFYIGLEARARKLGLLAKHYGVEPNDWFSLAYKMACDLVPGFQVLYDSPAARAIQSDPVMGPHVADLPVYYGNGTRPKGSGDLPEWMDGDMLIWMFRLFKEKFPKDNDIAVADKLVLCLDDSLAGAAHETKRNALNKTLRNRLSKARNAAPA
jgi:hypothetical protein